MTPNIARAGEDPLGVGHEAFEARFARELASLRQSSRTAGLVAGTYVDEAHGFGFVLPPGWGVRDPREVERVAEGRLVNSHHEELNDAFRSLTSDFLPLVVIAAPELDDPAARLGPHELGPVVAIHLEETISAKAAPKFDLWRHVAVDLAHFHGHIEDFRLLRKPARTTLSGCEAVTYRAAYTVLHADAVEGCPARERTFYVRQDRAVYGVRMCDYPDRDPRLEFDFDGFEKQIWFR
jgi:hypothetical protein